MNTRDRTQRFEPECVGGQIIKRVTSFDNGHTVERIEEETAELEVLKLELLEAPGHEKILPELARAKR